MQRARLSRRIPIRKLEQERLAAQKARGRRRSIARMLKWSGLLIVLAVIVAAVTYGVFFAPYATLRNMLPLPKRLISVVLVVNGVAHTVPAQGTLVVHPEDMLVVDDVHTDGRFNWGLKLQSGQFPASQLLEGRRQIGKFWPDYDYSEPRKVLVEVMAGSQSIGRFHMVVRLRARDWVEKAQAAGDLNKKVQYYERAARLASQNALILTNLARLYAEQGQWASAAATYENVVAFSSTIPVTEKLVEAYQKAGDTDAALNAYLKLIQISGPDKEPFYGFLSYLNAKKSPRRASAYLAANLNSFPKSLQPEVHAYLGTLLGQQGQWKKAISSYKQAVAGGMSDPLIDLNLGEAYRRIGSYSRAERHLRAYVQKKPGDVDGKLRLAEVYGVRKRYRNAIKLLKQVIEENPKQLKAHLALVHIYEKAKMDKQAAEAYEKIAALAPDNKVVHYNKGVLYFEMKQYDRAAKAFSQVLKLDKTDIDAREYLLRIYMDQKKPSKALAVLEELIQLRPTHWQYYPRAFELYDELKAYEEMTKTFARAVGSAADQPDLRFFLGMAYQRRGLFVEAIHQLESALKLTPKNKRYLSHLAGLYEQIGKVDAAIEAYRKVLDIDPDDSVAQENYLRLRIERMQKEKTG